MRCCICCQRSIGCSSETSVEGKYEELEAADKLLAVYFLERFFLVACRCLWKVRVAEISSVFGGREQTPCKADFGGVLCLESTTYIVRSRVLGQNRR